MRKVFISIFFICCIVISQITSAQTDTLNKSFPVKYEITYAADLVNNISGGIKKGSAYLGMANIKFRINTQNAGLWNGGEFFVNAANTHGATPSADLIGDFQTASNLEAGNITYLHELHYKQNFGKFTTIIGLHDLCSDFVSSENAAFYINSSFGVPSTISSNLPTPIFPLTAIGMQLHYRFSEKITAKFAIFDGLPDDFDINPHNLKWRLRKEDGYLTFSELNLSNIINGHHSYFKIGYYYHNGHKQLTEEEKTISIPANYGFYLIADQQIFEKSNGKKLAAFSQFSISPSSLNDNWYYIGLGINYHGLIKKRNNDIIGFALAHSGCKNKLHKHESAFSLTYKAELANHFFIQPDIQYIINPSGTETYINHAFLINLRFGLSFGN